jgi:hypothetical protein
MEGSHMGQVRHGCARITHALRANRAAEPDHQEAAVKRFHYESHDQLRMHLAVFMTAYYFACWLKTLSGPRPYKYIAKSWSSELDRFIVDPINQMPGPNT